MSPKQYGKPQQKTVSLLGERVSYTLTRKAVKNLNLRISREGKVSLSIPRWVSQAQAEAFLQAKAEFILAGQARAAQRQESHPLELPTREGNRVFLWGRPYVLRFGERAEIVSEESLWLKGPESAEKALQELYRLQCRVKAEEYLPEVLEDFADALPGLPTLRYRRMTSRWGSCNTKSRQITLNTRLAEYPPTALLAVLYHEVTHLLCPDHSQAFYRQLLLRCPKYREWTEVLK